MPKRAHHVLTHVPTSTTCLVSCSRNGCGAHLRSPFPARPKDPDGLGTFAAELGNELGVMPDEISITDIARAWARAFGYVETEEGWLCPQHGNGTPK